MVPRRSLQTTALWLLIGVISVWALVTLVRTPSSFLAIPMLKYVGEDCDVYACSGTEAECDLKNLHLSSCVERKRRMEWTDDGFQGQVTMGTEFGLELYNLAKQSDVQLVLELGTFKGGGSTMCLARGLKETSGFLITVEALLEHFLLASQATAQYPVKCLYGTTVTVDWNTFPTIAEVEANGGVDGGATPAAVYGKWLEGEKNTARFHEVPLLRPLCQKHKFDLIFMDGGEFYGRPELQIVLDHCKPKYLALHDANMFKNRDAVKVLSKPDSGYTARKLYTQAEGWAIFQAK